MVFKFLSKPDAKIEIVSSNRVLPGEVLPIEIRLTAQEEIKARELRLELIGEETYYVRETHRDSKGHTSTRVSKRTGNIASITKTVAEQPVFITGAEQRWNISQQIPPEALPTCVGKLVNINWKLKAVLDVPKQPDNSKEMPLLVICPSPKASKITGSGDDKVFDDAVLKLEIPPVASPGDVVLGRLALQLKNKLNPQGIRVELVRAEDAGARREDEVIVKTEISGSTSFNQYESPSFDFSLKIPSDAQPTAHSPHSSLRWKVKAVIARRMRTDFNIEREVLIYNSPEPGAK